MPTEAIIRTLKESREDNPKHILPRTVVKAVADEDGNFISSDVTAQDINNLHGKTFVTAEQQTLTNAQKEQVRNNIDAYTKPTDGIPATDLDDGVNASLDRANSAALPDGYYGDSGGVYQYSTNFVGKNAPTAANDLVFRPTASNFSGQDWSADSIGGQTATIEKIKGKTLVCNQLVNWDKISFHATSFINPTVISHDGEHYRLKVTVAEFERATYKRLHLWVDNSQGLRFKSTHKYYIKQEAVVDDNIITYEPGDTHIEYYDGVNYTNITYGTYGCNYRGIVTNILENSVDVKISLMQIYVSDVKRDAFIDVYFNIIDLTQMFGAGNEPTTPEEFEAMFPLDYYAYNPGELVSFNGTGLKTTGFNQLYPDGHIDVLAGLTYKIEGTYTSLKDSAGNDVIVTNGEFTPTSNDTYTMVGGSCVHLKWSGVRDGETEPHWDSTLSLPIADYFADGMKSAGTVYDELTKDKAIQRVVGLRVYCRDYNNYVASSGDFYCFAKRYDTRSRITNAAFGYAENYMITGGLVYHRGLSETYDGTVYVAGNCAILGYTIEEFNALTRAEQEEKIGQYFETHEVYVAYPLREPIETPISPELNLTYHCDDFGTEMLLPQNTDEPVTAPMDADIVYQLDYEAQIRNNGSLNITKESMDAFISAFNGSGLGTITQTWDSTNKRYAYTVTAPQPEPTEGGETV